MPYLRIIKKNLQPGGTIFLFTLTPKSASTNGQYQKVKQNLSEEGIELVNYNYTPFGLLMGLKFFYILLALFFLSIKNRVNSIHAWCTPGGAVGYIISLVTGKPLILDSFEPHAQSMVETGTWKKNGIAFRILFRLEKLQLKRAKVVICAAEGMIRYSQETYGITKPVYYVKPACVDLELFSKKEKNYGLVNGISKDSVVCVYIGKFEDIYLSHEVFDFFKVAASFWGDKFRVLLLTNHSDKEVADYCHRSGLDPGVVVKLFAAHSQVPNYLSLGDFGICPVRPVPTKKYCTPIKDAEYWAMGLPVVITKNISTDSKLISEENIGYVLQQLNSSEYLNAVKKIAELLKDKTLCERIRKIAETQRNYSIAKEIYRAIYF
ncbi:MAG: hypothetical protein V4635_08235 [Bacteroidota bacterium]